MKTLRKSQNSRASPDHHTVANIQGFPIFLMIGLYFQQSTLSELTIESKECLHRYESFGVFEYFLCAGPLQLSIKIKSFNYEILRELYFSFGYR